MAGKIFQFSRHLNGSKRRFATLAEPLATTQGAHGGHGQNAEEGIKLWKKVFYFVCIPTLVIGFTSVYLEGEAPPPPFQRYPYLRIRNKKYPWRDGVKTLFHNPHTNALPDGYEHVEGHH